MSGKTGGSCFVSFFRQCMCGERNDRLIVPLIVESLLTFHEKYVDNVSTYRVTEAEKKLALRQAGLAMKAFLAWAQSEQVVNDLSAMQSLKAMRTVFVQNFIDNSRAPELIKVATGKKHICKPEPRGKIYIQRPENERLSQRRKQLEDPEYRKDLNHRKGGRG